MKITEIWLRNNATPTSYSRGEDYIDEVNKLTKRGNTYTAQVYGSDIYHVTIESNAFDANCFCSCPYDWGGICKHVVAVGLNIIAGNYKDLSSATETTIDHLELEAVSPTDANTFFKDIFLTTEETTRAAFLEQLFLKDSTLRAQFLQFIDNNSQEIILTDIDEVAEELRRILNELDFDINDLYGRNSRNKSSSYSYYGDDDDDLSEAAIEVVEEAIEPYEKQAHNYLEKGNLQDAVRTILGIYEATYGLEEPYFEEYHFFDNLQEEAQNIFLSILHDLGESCKKIVKNEETVQKTIDLIVQRWKYFYQSETENEFGIQYDFQTFDGFFTGLVTTLSSAEYLLSLLENYERYSYNNSSLYLHLASVLKDEELELKILEDFASNSVDLSKQLILFYHNKNQKGDFYRVARQAFNIFPNHLDTFLLEKITANGDYEFYVEVLRYFTKERNNIEGYKKLKEFWTNEQTEAFIEDNRLNSAFYVQMLEVEKRYEEILQVVKTNKDSWGFDKLTQPILNIYPDQMLRIYFERAYRAMGPGAQDRRKYRQVAKDLKPILQITQLSDKRKDLIKQLKNKYRYLPAFIDEMNKAGF